MHARSALFDVFGDHLPERAHQSPVAAVVRLLEPVGIAAPAVRTAVSRMVLQGWLEPVVLPAGRGYRATPRAVRRLEDAAARIYQRRPRPWDGRWHLALVTPPQGRGGRGRLRDDLTYLGYARLGDDLWVSPHARDELLDVLDRASASAITWSARDFHPATHPLAAWDLERLRTSYAAWLAEAGDLVAQHLAEHRDPDEAAFAARFHLVHEWRKFLFTDPGLPDELLPAGWPGRAAHDYFATEADRLKPGAARFVDRCLDD